MAERGIFAVNTTYRAAFSVSCPDPLAEVAGFVGLAGPYDIARIPEVALPMFGTAPTADPDRWRAGSPLTYATAHPALPVLLVHGDADELVPIDFTTEFADAMTSAGHDVEIKIVRGGDSFVHLRSRCLRRHHRGLAARIESVMT